MATKFTAKLQVCQLSSLPERTTKTRPERKAQWHLLREALRDAVAALFAKASSRRSNDAVR